MFGSIVSSLVQGAVSALIAPIVQWWNVRQLVKQGQALQKAADDAATVKEATDAVKIDEADAGLSDAQLDARLREPAPGAGQ